MIHKATVITLILCSSLKAVVSKLGRTPLGGGQIILLGDAQDILGKLYGNVEFIEVLKMTDLLCNFLLL
jgi:hypothetical protein